MATTTYAREVDGDIVIGRTIDAPSGTPANDAGKVPSLGDLGFLPLGFINATTTSAGAASANKPAALNALGYLDETMMPPGVAADVKILPTSEVIANGAYVNTYDSGSGVLKVRNADYTAVAKRAMGFCQVGQATIGSNVTVYFEGKNTGVTGRGAAKRQFLGPAGTALETAPVVGTGGVVAGYISQFLGDSVSATEVAVEIARPIILG